MAARGLLDDAHDVGLLHDEELLAVELDLGAGPLAEQDAVAGLDVERLNLAALVAGAGADGDDLALLRLFLGGVGNDDAALGPLLGLDAADDDAVVQWTESMLLDFLSSGTKPADVVNGAVSTRAQVSASRQPRR